MSPLHYRWLSTFLLLVLLCTFLALPGDAALPTALIDLQKGSYDDCLGTGAPCVRVDIGGASVTLTMTDLNLTKVNSVAIATGNGVVGSAVQRVAIASDNSPLAVTGTFFQSTQPVSIASMPTTPVTGTFFQSTQPVSIATMPTTPVTGTFFQSTQPVSVASLPLPTGGATEATLAALGTPGAAPCKTLKANLQGSALADITVDATSGGVTVLGSSITRCGAVIKLVSGGQIKCLSSGQGNPSTTAGFTLDVGDVLGVDTEAQEAYKCIRTGGTSGIVTVVEKTT